MNEDGEWEAYAGDESDEELTDAANVLVWSLGYLTDRFPQTTDALREGSRLSQRDVWWEWDGDAYTRVP